MKHKSGIYRIINKINGKSYFGQAIYLKKRWSDHKGLLNKNKHRNIYLQRSWNKYGEKNFIFTIHIYCPIEDLDKEEQICLDLCKKVPELFYNISYDVEHSNRGSKRSEETKKKQSLAKIGKNHSEETIEKMSLSKKALYENGYIHPQYDHTIYHFYNKKLNIKENCNRYDLFTKYKLNRGNRGNLCEVISGKRKSTGGWSIIKN